jgi:hypothetical protein
MHDCAPFAKISCAIQRRKALNKTLNQTLKAGHDRP